MHPEYRWALQPTDTDSHYAWVHCVCRLLRESPQSGRLLEPVPPCKVQYRCPIPKAGLITYNRPRLEYAAFPLCGPSHRGFARR